MTAIVSLSTIPSRFTSLGPVLDSLLAQTAQIDEIRLYVPKRFRRFPDYDGSLPDVPKDVRIIQTAEDLGPASKVLFAADDLKGEDCDIFFCDDDMLHPPEKFQTMLDERGARTDTCVAAEAGFIFDGKKRLAPSRAPAATYSNKDLGYRKQRAAQIWREFLTGTKEEKPFLPDILKPGYVNVAQGFGGVLVRPNFFDDLFYDIPPVIWAVDDYWLSGHFERKKIPIWAMAGGTAPLEAVSRDVSALHSAIIDGVGRNDANEVCIKYMQDTYGIWKWVN